MSLRVMAEHGPPGESGFFADPDGDMVVTTRLPGDHVYLAAGTRMEERRLDQGEARAILSGVLAPYTAELVAGVRARSDDGLHVIARPFEWLIVGAPWHRGRVVLVGDAVHATTPHLSSGGGMAVEDGAVLGQELGRCGALDRGLRAFAERRLSRVSLVVRNSVELLALQDRGAPPAEGMRLRAAAMAALSQPY